MNPRPLGYVNTAVENNLEILCIRQFPVLFLPQIFDLFLVGFQLLQFIQHLGGVRILRKDLLSQGLQLFVPITLHFDSQYHKKRGTVGAYHAA